jgi:hypothetical protein
MKNVILLTFVLSALSCAPAAPPAKTYSRPEVGMMHTNFDELCKPTTQSADLVSVAGPLTTLILVSTPERESNGCSGTFRFRDNKLESIQKR